MKLVTAVLAVLLTASPAALAQSTVQDPPAAAGGAPATPITPEAPTTHSAPGASTEASPATPPAPAAAAPTKAVDIAKAVDCATLSQQFGDTLTALTGPTAKTPLDETVKTTSSDQAGAGRKACMAHDYDAGLDQLREALQEIGLKPSV